MEIEKIRKNIDELDDRIVKLIAERLGYSHHVAEYKEQHGLHVHQPEREKEIIDKKRELAKDRGLNPKLAEDIFRLIIKESSRIQRERLG